MKPLCIYHANCDDGFGAAWAVQSAVPGMFEFYPGVHGKEPPNVTDRHVLMVDFSYKRSVLVEMARQARSIIILDHHKSAVEDLAGFSAPAPFHEWHLSDEDKVEDAVVPIAALFDMDRSGAGIAWDFFHNKLRPDFINYIEDRDLWRKKLPGGDEFTIALRSYPQTFEIWDKLEKEGAHSLIAEGTSLQRYYRLRIEEFKRQAYMAELGQACNQCYIANVPYFAASEVAGELAEREGAEFGACYFEVQYNMWQYSLRSRDEFDVSKIAEYYGGGGHKNAAGFVWHGSKPLHKAK